MLWRSWIPWFSLIVFPSKSPTGMVSRRKSVPPFRGMHASHASALYIALLVLMGGLLLLRSFSGIRRNFIEWCKPRRVLILLMSFVFNGQIRVMCAKRML
jgi:hypothetical protein